MSVLTILAGLLGAHDGPRRRCDLYAATVVLLVMAGLAGVVVSTRQPGIS
jgi:hypothetical protein